MWYSAPHTKTWDSQDEELVQIFGVSLLHPEESHPQFGSAIRAPLSDGNGNMLRSIATDEEGKAVHVYEKKTAALPTTLFNLAVHFGYMRWMEDNFWNISRHSHGTFAGEDLDERVIRALRRYARDDFTYGRVYPIRYTLEKPPWEFYFHCVPSGGFETELITGKLIHPEGARVLCVLPKSEQIAVRYNLTDIELEWLAGQIIWLIVRFCQWHTLLATMRNSLKLLMDGPNI